MQWGRKFSKGALVLGISWNVPMFVDHLTDGIGDSAHYITVSNQRASAREGHSASDACCALGAVICLLIARAAFSIEDVWPPHCGASQTSTIEAQCCIVVLWQLLIG